MRLVGYYRRRLATANPSPIKPEPKRRSEPGSGTVLVMLTISRAPASQQPTPTSVLQLKPADPGSPFACLLTTVPPFGGLPLMMLSGKSCVPVVIVWVLSAYPKKSARSVFPLVVGTAVQFTNSLTVWVGWDPSCSLQDPRRIACPAAQTPGAEPPGFTKVAIELFGAFPPMWYPMVIVVSGHRRGGQS